MIPHENSHMPRDLLIHGLNQAKFYKQLQFHFLPVSPYPEELSRLLGKFQTDIRIIDKLTLEEYLYKNHGLSTEEQHLTLGVQLLIELRSSPLCLAIAQLVDHYIEAINEELSIQEGSLMLSKSQTLSLVDWLIVMSKALSTEAETKSPNDISPQLQQIAKALSRLPVYQTEEFADFGERYSLFMAWKKGITESEFDCYYWEDAY